MNTTLAMVAVLVLLLGGAGLVVRRRFDATLPANPPSPGTSLLARLLVLPVAVVGDVVAFAVVPHAGAGTAPTNISVVQTPAAGATECLAAAAPVSPRSPSPEL